MISLAYIITFIKERKCAVVVYWLTLTILNPAARVRVLSRGKYTIRLRSLHRAYPEPSSLRDSTLGARAAEQQGCNWGMQVDWWLQHRAVFGHTFSGIIWYYATEIKSIQLHDSIVMALPWDNIVYIYIYI